MSPATTKIWTARERQAWRLPEKITVTEWADRHRMLPADSAWPGPYRSKFTPYMRGPQDAFTDREVEEITVMSAAQVSKSTSMQNMVAYCIDQDPGPALYVVPREDDVPYISQKIFKPMVEDSDQLRPHAGDSSRDLQTNFHTFDRMSLYFGWAGSPAALAQKAIRYLFLDEPDKYPPFSGREGNPVDLAEERTRTYWDFKIVKMCTPTMPLAYIAISYNESNMQEYYIPCPRCGEYQVWKFEQLKLPKTLRQPEEIIKKGDVWYECESCRHKIHEDGKAELVAAGRWLPDGQKVDVDGNVTGKPLRGKRHSGFHISALVSPFPGVTWPRLLARWFKANTEEGIAVGKLMVFFNSVRGEPFEEIGTRIEATDLEPLRGGFSRGTVPDDCVILVASGDYHKTFTRGIPRIDYEVRGFAPGMRNYIIDSGPVGSFEELDDRVLKTPFPWAAGTPPEEKPWLVVSVLFVDSGYEPDDVYEYCRPRRQLAVPTKGEPGPRAKPLQVSRLEDATERRLSAHKRRRYRGMQLLIVDTYFFKNQVTAWAEPRRDEEGNVTAPALTSFYAEIPTYYFKEFTNERKVREIDKKGNVRYVWKPVSKGAQTHTLDTAVLCAAAAFYKQVHYLQGPDDKKVVTAAGRKTVTLSQLQKQRRQ